MIIDGHAHACGEYYDFESIIKILDRNKADKLVLCPGEPDSRKNYSLPLLSEKKSKKDYMFVVNKIIGFVIKLSGASKHIDQQNRYVYQLSQKAPDRIIQAYWINPNDKDCLTKLEKDYLEFNFRILKMHQCWNKFDLANESINQIIKWAQRIQMPIFIHISNRAQVDAFIKIANTHPDTFFIVAHLIGFEAINKNINNKNVYYEISPPQLISAERLKKAIAEAGADKIILGSDTPYGKNNLQINIDRINDLEISDQEKDLIKGGNMYNILFPNTFFL